jgi:hypothetical protein
VIESLTLNELHVFFFTSSSIPFGRSLMILFAFPVPQLVLQLIQGGEELLGVVKLCGSHAKDGILAGCSGGCCAHHARSIAGRGGREVTSEKRGT